MKGLCLCSKPEEDIQAFDTAAEVAPHVQDFFDLDESELKELDVKDRPENKVCSGQQPRPGKRLAMTASSNKLLCRKSCREGYRVQKLIN